MNFPLISACPLEHLHDAQAFRQHLVGSQRLGEAQVAIEILHRRAHRPRLVVTGGAAEHFARVEDLRLAQGRRSVEIKLRVVVGIPAFHGVGIGGTQPSEPVQAAAFQDGSVR